MFVSRVFRLRLRQPTRTLHSRSFASKSTVATPKAVPERTTVAETPQTGGEQPRAQPDTRQHDNDHNSSRLSRRRRSHRRTVLLRTEHRPRRTELPQGSAPGARPSRRGVSDVAVEVARQVRVAG